MKRSMGRGALLLCGLVSAGPALAQTSTPIDRNRLDRDQPLTPPPAEIGQTPTSATRVEADDSATAAEIQGIRFEGVEVPLIVARAAERFIGQRATAETLRALVAAMSEAYGESEVALFTIVIPQQDLGTGFVRVQVAEGHVEAVILDGEVEGRRLELVKAMASKITRERPTSRRVLERYLSLIRDIPGLKVDAQLQMGEARGAVRLVLKLDFQRSTLTAGFDNRTTRLIKDGQFQATARIYRGLREGDITEIVGATSVDFEDYRYFGITHSTPLGSEGLRFAINGGYLDTRPRGSPIRGEARTAGLSLNYPLVRGYRRNVTLTAAFDGLNSDNAAFGSLIASERTRAARGAIGFSDVRARRSLSAGVTLSKGLDILGARVDAPLAETGFVKANARAGIDQAIGKRLVARVRASGQWSPDRLPAAERFSVGGADFGRGFETAIVSADRGYAGLAELAFLPVRQGDFARSELYGFADMARVAIRARGTIPKQTFDLASAGAGIRFAWGQKVNLELEGARVLDKPFAGYEGDWRISVGWRISLRR